METSMPRRSMRIQLFFHPPLVHSFDVGLHLSEPSNHKSFYYVKAETNGNEKDHSLMNASSGVAAETNGNEKDHSLMNASSVVAISSQLIDD
ncbi:hypothetical protein M514_20591 [Trichuris suis]|uniref:Uncharacterized protein n=1 Tax=Trichuris suis TaxID=68888 RepID=A0A085NCF9_9BILA|nr:hypothetical protein M514_20591 [Trichuris suis]